MKYPRAKQIGILNSSHPRDIKVRLTHDLPSIHKNSRKLVGILRTVFTDKEQHQRGFVYFPFIGKRFIIPLSLLKRIEN